MTSISLFKTAFTTGDYYKAMNNALKTLDGSYQMLHYPYYSDEMDTFDDAQENLIQYCIDHFPTLEGKQILDLGCGNGTVAMYLSRHNDVKHVLGVDLNDNNIRIANEIKDQHNHSRVSFIRDDAQQLEKIDDNSYDIVINIESAFHYPDKGRFLEEVRRVLKPGGQFVIADIVTTNSDSSIFKKWKHKMNFNHWTLNEYTQAFNESHLNLISSRDISKEIIKGFQAYPHFLRDFTGNQLLRLFFLINVKLNIYLLSRKRNYYVFHGNKTS